MLLHQLHPEQLRPVGWWLVLFLLMATSRSASAQDMARRLYDAHETYKQQALTHRRFKHRDMVPLLDSLRGQGPLAISQVGESLEKRAINCIDRRRTSLTDRAGL